jgi:hypothetical protein
MKPQLQFHLVQAFGRMILDEIGQEQVQELVGKLAKARSRHTIQRLFSGWRKRGANAVAGFQQRDLVIPCSKPVKPGRFFRPGALDSGSLLRSPGTQSSRSLC